MNAKTVRTVQIPSELTVVVALSKLLQRLEVQPLAVAPEQYRAVAERLADALQAAPQGEALQAVLAWFPAAAEVWENLQYAHAGLCRSPLEASLNAELKARELIGLAARRPA